MRLRDHDDRAQFEAGVDIILRGITPSVSVAGKAGGDEGGGLLDARPEGTRGYPRRRSAVSTATSTRAVMPGTSTGRRPAT